MRRLPLLLILSAGLMILGCSSDNRVSVQGTVTYAGEPIGIGTITFLPTGDKGIKAGGPITDGKYAIEAKFGLNPGPHRVEIHWLKPTGKKYKNEFGEEFDRTIEGLPDKYHKDSRLTAEIKSSNNVINFDLEK